MKLNQVEVGLEVMSYSDSQFDEIDQSELTLAFRVYDAKTKAAYNEKPVYVSLALLDPATKEALYRSGKPTSTANGIVTFKIAPKNIEDIENYDAVEARYSFTHNEKQTEGAKTIALKFKIPNKIELVQGDSQTGEEKKKLEKKLTVRVLDKYQRALPAIDVQWRVKTGNGFVTSDAKTNSEGISSAEWTLGDDLEEQQVEVVVKKKNGSHVSGSPMVFKATLLNPWHKKLIGKWKAEQYMVLTDAGYKKMETEYWQYMNNPNNVQSHIWYKLLGNNTIQWNITLPVDITFKEDLNYDHLQTPTHGCCASTSKGTWSVTRSGTLTSYSVSDYWGTQFNGTFSGKVEEINATTLKITTRADWGCSNCTGQYTILRKQ